MAETCPKCGYARVETDTCPRCRVIVSQYGAYLLRRRENSFLVLVGRIRKAVSPASQISDPRGRQGHLKCPRCSTPLAKLDTPEGVVVHYCQGCSGTWHDKGILDEFSRLSGLPELLQGKPVFSQPSDLRCPRCEVPMERIGLGAEKFLVGRCRSCQGLWLDHGETAKLSQLAGAKPPPAMTSPECQSLREGRARPEEVVAGQGRHPLGTWYDKGKRRKLIFLAVLGPLIGTTLWVVHAQTKGSCGLSIIELLGVYLFTGGFGWYLRRVWKTGELWIRLAYPPKIKKAREPYIFWLSFILYTLVFAVCLAGSIVNTFLWLLDC